LQSSDNFLVGADPCVRPELSAHTRVRPYNAEFFDCDSVSEKYFQVRRMVSRGTKIRRARLTRRYWCVGRTLRREITCLSADWYYGRLAHRSCRASTCCQGAPRQALPPSRWGEAPHKVGRMTRGAGVSSVWKGSGKFVKVFIIPMILAIFIDSRIYSCLL